MAVLYVTGPVLYLYSTFVGAWTGRWYQRVCGFTFQPRHILGYYVILLVAVFLLKYLSHRMA